MCGDIPYCAGGEVVDADAEFEAILAADRAAADEAFDDYIERYNADLEFEADEERQEQMERMCNLERKADDQAWKFHQRMSDINAGYESEETEEIVDV